MIAGGIVVIMSGFPRRSETFALAELLALDAHGLLARVFATKPGDGEIPQPGVDRLIGRVDVVEPGAPLEQAATIANRLRGTEVAGVHAYFAHTPAEIAVEVSRRLKVPYGFSVHARDARKVARDALVDRARRAACVIACNPDVADEIGACGAAVSAVPHGVDLERFVPRPARAASPLRLVAVGRLVEKKGFDVLVAAVARLSFPFQLRIIGDGPERDALAAEIAARGLSASVTLTGGCTHADLPREYAEADVIVVPSKADRVGDRDGLPNVLLEAMASARPVVASDIGATRSAVSDNETGLLVPPGNAHALATALEKLAVRPDLRARLGASARARVEADFDLDRCTNRLCELLGRVYA